MFNVLCYMIMVKWYYLMIKKICTAKEALRIYWDKMLLLFSITSSGYLANGETLTRNVTRINPLEWAKMTHRVPSTLRPWMNWRRYSVLVLSGEILNRILIFLNREKHLIKLNKLVSRVENVSNNVPAITNTMHDFISNLPGYQRYLNIRHQISN